VLFVLLCGKKNLNLTGHPAPLLDVGMQNLASWAAWGVYIVGQNFGTLDPVEGECYFLPPLPLNLIVEGVKFGIYTGIMVSMCLQNLGIPVSKCNRYLEKNRTHCATLRNAGVFSYCN